MAIAKPPKVNVFIEIPIDLNIIAVITRERGIAVRVIIVVRKLSRNKNSIIITKINPSLNAPSTLLSEFTIKSFCLKTFV